ncbi:phage minor head protein [Stenotrophomonas maltophilia]|uniref:phage head morphogenesis protein n=1 Tax=Stenotrophomonas maltophilia TaxID=40324 RepID=UPI000C258A41|nr:phage minor head protein [Stenotrophomonas maltophilia]PJL35525.1 hypothetical protein B9Y56_21715 [Stenotrophomonas maltophilia]
MAGVAYAQLPFREQIEFFRRKKNVLTESYLDVWESEHDSSFMVAGANRDALLADFRQSIDRVIAEGRTLQQFREDFDRIVATHGWDYNGGRNWRSRVIYETNLRQSYNAGRWAQLQQLIKVRPFWRYNHNDAVEHPRPLHVSWNGLVLRHDDPWWRYHYPANGWGCQCYVDALNERDLRRLGKNGPDKAPEIVMQSVTVGQRSPGGPHTVLTPAGVDPGFGYAPGATADHWPGGRGGPVTPPSLTGQLTSAVQNALETGARLPAAPAAASAAQALARPRARDALQAGYASWLASIDADAAHAARYLAGALSPGLVSQLQRAAVRPATAAFAVLADQLPITRPGAVAIAAAELPIRLLDAVAILLDAAAGRLRYVLAVGRPAFMVVDVAISETGVSTVQSQLQMLMPAELQRGVADGTLQLLQGTL